MSDALARGDEGSQPLPPSGEGSELFDAPSLFYLTHRATIDDWARLREEASRATDEWLSTVIPRRLERVAAAIGWTVSQVKGRIFLHPTQMPMHLDRPVCAIGLAWTPTSVSPATAAMWTGVRVEPKFTEAPAREFFVAEAHDRLEPDAGWKPRADPSWPIYRYLDGVERWWTNLDGFRERLADEMTATTERFGDSILAVLARFDRPLGGPGAAGRTLA
jgi:hypothetical protein